MLSVRIEIFWLNGNLDFAACFECVTFYLRCCAILLYGYKEATDTA